MRPCFKPGETIFVLTPVAHEKYKNKGWICKYIGRSKQKDLHGDPIVRVQIEGRQRPILVSLLDCYELKPEHYEQQRPARVKSVGEDQQD